METPQKDSLILPVSGVILILAAAVGLTWLDRPLKSRRPEQPEGFVRETFESEDVRARLWQDPFEAVFAARKALGEESPNAEKSRQLSNLAKLIWIRTGVSENQKASTTNQPEESGNTTADREHQVVLMPVMVPGSSFSGDAETRRRTRQAIVSALAVKGYVPVSGERIGYVETFWESPGRLKTATSGISVTIPFEWFQRDLLRPDDRRADDEWVLVLWLDEEAFHENTMLKINELFARLLEAPDQPTVSSSPSDVRDHPDGRTQIRDGAAESEVPHSKGSRISNKIKLRLIGPSSSSTLLKMLDPSARGLIETPSRTVEELLTHLRKIHDSLDGIAKRQGTHELVAPLFYSDVIKVPVEIEEEVGPEKIGPEPIRPEGIEPEEVSPIQMARVEADKKWQFERDTLAKDVGASSDVIWTSFAGFVSGRLEMALGRKADSMSVGFGDVHIIRRTLTDPEFWAYLYQKAYRPDDEAENESQVSTEDTSDGSTGFDRWLRTLQEFMSRELQGALREYPNLRENWARVVVNDWLSEGDSTPYVLRDRLEIYSNRATAPEALLVRQGRLRGSPLMDKGELSSVSDQEVRDAFKRHYDVKFVSTVTRDDDLAMALVDELQRRGVDLVGSTQHVALISEWDTFYGRALPLAMEAVIQHRRGEESAQWSRKGTLKLMLVGDVSTPPRVHRFSYMRGLDGSAPGSQQRASSTAKDAKRTDKPWEVDVNEWERPVGTSGVDYMRRVADKLTTLDRSLAEKGERLGAIGVVGSDVYDKLLVLQALRNRFPNVIFFTTDLDARLLHPSQYPWCRNLVVASGYGLEMAPPLQQHIPPFRDGYQTGTFLACMLALGGVQVDVTDPCCEDRQWNSGQAGTNDEDDAKVRKITLTGDSNLDMYLKPQLFEVARSGAYDITPLENGSALHPTHTDGRPTVRTMVVLLLLSFVAGLLLIPLNQTFRRFTIGRSQLSRRDREGLNYFTVLAILVLVGICLVIYFDGRDGKGEPFELFEGISIWPTEILRLGIILLSWGFVASAIRSIRKSNEELQQENMTPPDEIPVVKGSFWKQWQRLRDRSMSRRADRANRSLLAKFVRFCVFEWRCFWESRMRISINTWRHDEKANRRPKEVGRVWARYLELGRISNRFWRCIPLALIYLLFGWCLSLLFGDPAVPYRGPIAQITDTILMMLAGFSLVVLTFFVVDATRLCEVFVRELSNRRTHWPETNLIARLERERGMTREDLADFIDVQVIARRTEVIGWLITYPFIVLFVGLIALNGYFDNWEWSAYSMLFFVLILAYAIICAVVLRRAAEKARRKAVARIEDKLSLALSSKDRKGGNRVEQFRLLITEIRELRRGAFTPLARHPIVRAVLIPFGGVGTLLLLDFLATLGG